MSQQDLCILHDDIFLKNQRFAGEVVAKSLDLLENFVKEKTKLSLVEMDKIIEDFILKNNCTPTFKNYKGFPNSCCMSVNKELVHSIPTDRVLQDGDLISFDLGATYNGAVADAAITLIYGNCKDNLHNKLIETTKLCLYNAIKSIKIEKRIGNIGYNIFHTARKNGFKVIENYGGHGISISSNNEAIPHGAPFISNKSEIDDGIRIQANMSLAIEPLLVIGNSTETKIMNDGWTVCTNNISAHFEDTLFIHNDHVEIITYRENNLFPTNKIYFN